MDIVFNDHEEIKRLKRHAKKARRKSEARIKWRMETIRTCCSAGAFVLALLGFLRVYQFI